MAGRGKSGESMSVSPLRTVETSVTSCVISSAHRKPFSPHSNLLSAIQLVMLPISPAPLCCSVLFAFSESDRAPGFRLCSWWELCADGSALTSAPRLVLPRGSQNPDFLHLYGNYSFMKVSLLLTAYSSPIWTGIVAPWWSAGLTSP